MATPNRRRSNPNVSSSRSRKGDDATAGLPEVDAGDEQNPADETSKPASIRKPRRRRFDPLLAILLIAGAIFIVVVVAIAVGESGVLKPKDAPPPLPPNRFGWQPPQPDDTAQAMLVIRGHAYQVMRIQYSSDGKLIVAAGLDPTPRVWEAETGKPSAGFHSGEPMVFPPFEAPMTHSACFTPNGERIVSGEFHGQVCVWRTATGERVLRLKEDLKQEQVGHIPSATVHPDGAQFATGSDEGTIGIWEIQSGRKLRTIEAHSDIVHRLQYSSDGKQLVSASADKTIRVWNATTGERVQSIDAHEDYILGLAVSLDGKRFASGGKGETVRIWDAGSGKLVREVAARGGFGVECLAFSPDGTRLASGDVTGNVRVFNTSTGQELLKLKAHLAEVRDVCFRPDGKAFASSSADKTIKVWDLSTLEQPKGQPPRERRP